MNYGYRDCEKDLGLDASCRYQVLIKVLGEMTRTSMNMDLSHYTLITHC